MARHDDIYESFWKELVEKDGVVDMDAVKRELADYHHVLNEVPKVYVAITGGKMSKPSYYASDVIAVHDDEVNRACEESVEEWRKHNAIS